MNQIYDTQKELKKQDLAHLFAQDRRALERELEKSGVIRRKRKLKSYGTLLRATWLFLIRQLSFRRLAHEMEVMYGVRMSANAWKKQLSKFAQPCWEAVQRLMSRKADSTHQHQTIVMDATHFSMEGSNPQTFRVHTTLSLDPRLPDQFILTNCRVAESVRNFTLHPGCCYLADRAYGNASQMAYLIEQHADFIFRISPSRIKLFSDLECRQRIDYQTLLSETAFSIRCFFTYRSRSYPIQLSGSMLPPEKQEAARQRANKISHRKQNKTRPQTLFYANWLLLASSLPQHNDNVFEIYRQRWQIELFFKTAKSLLNFHKLRRCSLCWAKKLLLIWIACLSSIAALCISARRYFPDSASFFLVFDAVSALFS